MKCRRQEMMLCFEVCLAGHLVICKKVMVSAVSFGIFGIKRCYLFLIIIVVILEIGTLSTLK